MAVSHPSSYPGGASEESTPDLTEVGIGSRRSAEDPVVIVPDGFETLKSVREALLDDLFGHEDMGDAPDQRSMASSV